MPNSLLISIEYVNKVYKKYENCCKALLAMVLRDM